MPKLGIAVFGACGFGRFHVREIIKAGCPVLAILGRTKDSVRNTAANIERDYGVKVRPYWDLQEILKNREIGAVSVCTPPELHWEHVARSLEASLHVICEKPFLRPMPGGYYGLASELFELADKKGKVLTVNTQLPALIEQLPPLEEIPKEIKIEMESGSSSMILEDMLPHALSLIIQMTSPNGRIKNLKFQERDKIRICFSYCYPNGESYIDCEIGFNPLRPRKLAFSYGAEYFQRIFTRETEQVLVSPSGKTYEVKDPLEVSISRFVNCAEGSGKPLVSREEILTNVRLYADLLVAFTR